jgi:hypothetical protein
VSTVRFNTSLYSSHLIILPYLLSDLYIAQHTIYPWLISSTYDAGTTKLTLALSSHFGEDMAFVLVLMLVTRSRLFEAFGSSTMCLTFWHFISPIVMRLSYKKIRPDSLPKNVAERGSRFLLLLASWSQNHGHLSTFHFWVLFHL